MKMKKRFFNVAFISGFTVLLAGCAGNSADAVQGLGFYGHDGDLLVASSAGTSVYSKGTWRNARFAQGNQIHAINTVRGGVYALMGNSQSEIIFGSSDTGFPDHWNILKTAASPKLMTASYFTHTLYVWMDKDTNGKPDSSGLFYSKDDGAHWRKCAAQGFPSSPTSVASHPANDAIVALGRPDGLWLSKDYGMHFRQVYAGMKITALFFGQAGELYVAGKGEEGKPFLLTYDYNLNTKYELGLPPLLEDPVSYFSEDLENRKDMAFATNRQSIYFSRNKGGSWFQVGN